MRHRVGFKTLGVKESHRKALKRNLITSLFKHERIETTLAKAKGIQSKAEKMITRAKVDSVHNRRIIAKDIAKKDILNKLFTDISLRFKDRAGGYTRIVKTNFRHNDSAKTAIIELVVKTEKKAKETSKDKKKVKKEEKKEKVEKVEKIDKVE